MAMIELRQFSAGYPGREWTVRNVNLAIQPGETVGLIGPNGSGKTTLIRGICARIPFSGSCCLDGKTPANVRELAQIVSLIPQRTSILFSIPVLDVVLMGANSRLPLLAQPSAAQRQTARDLLRQVGMAGREEQDFLTLSEGQKQLVILARALLQDTPVLLLDEPDSALDYNNKHLLLDTVRTLCGSRERTVLLTMHDVNLAMQYCTRLILLKEGQLCGDLRLKDADADSLTAALQQIYPGTRVIRADSHWIMVKEEPSCTNR